MVDITKCEGEGCKVKKKCYRFTVVANPYMQSYFVKTPVPFMGPKGPKCEHFWDRK